MDGTGDLWARFAANPTAELRNKIVMDNIEEVKKIAGRLARTLPRHVGQDGPDGLLAAGTCGLIAAMRKYDPARKVLFATFCGHRVRGAMLDELREGDILTRPDRARQRTLERALDALTRELGREPRNDELAAALGISVAEIGELGRQKRAATIVSLSEPVSSRRRDGDPGRRQDFVEDTRSRSALDRLVGEEALARVTADLPERERRIFLLRHLHGHKLKTIGAELKISESRVSQLLTRVMRRLRGRARVGNSR